MLNTLIPMAQHSSSRRAAAPAKPRRPLSREITVVLVVKLLALCLLWFAFFRVQPPADPANLLSSGSSNSVFSGAPSHQPSSRGEGVEAQESSS